MMKTQKRHIVFGLMSVVLVAGMTMLAGCGAGASVHPTATAIPPTSTSTPTHPAGPVVTAPISSVTMFSTTAGWGTVQSSTNPNLTSRIAYTVDGGSTWYDVTPSGLVAGSSSAYVYPLSATEARAWASSDSGGNGPTPLWHTSDAGAHWSQQGTMPDGATQMDFIDSTHGWLTCPNPRGNYTGHTPKDVYHTTDGGATWTKVASAIALSHTNGVGFANATTGFVTGDDVATGGFLIEMTHDAGVTWTDVSSLLPKPSDYMTNGAMSNVEPPVFTSATDGVLLVLYPTQSAAKLAIYRTVDAGTTWTLEPTLNANFPRTPTNVTTSGEVFAATTTNGSVTLYDLPVGASSWTQIQTSSPLLAGLSQIDFPDATHGWAVTKAGLIGTTDGGVTWVVLHA